MTKKRSYTAGDLKKIQQLVEKDSQKNIKKIVFPNNVQIGAGSNLPSTLNVGGEIKGYIHTLSDGSTPYMLAQGGISITSASNGQLIISSSNGGGGGGGAVSAVANGVDNRIATFSAADALNGEENLTFDGSILNVKGAVNINPDSGDNDFIVKDDNSKLAIHVNANQGAIQFFDTNSDDIGENDVNFYVRGTAGSRGTSTRGTSLFEGDLVTSGSIFAGNNVIRDSFGNKKIEFTNIGMVLSSSYGVEDFDKAVTITHSGVSITYDLTVGDDLVVTDHARAKALSVGSSNTKDPGDGNLRVEGRTELESDTTVTGSLSIHQNLIVTGSLYATSNILQGSTPTDGQVISWNSSLGKLVWKTVSSSVLLAFVFDSGIQDFTVSDMSMFSFAALNAFDPRTAGTIISGSQEPAV
jgi:hypothetical protein